MYVGSPYFERNEGTFSANKQRSKDFETSVMLA